MSQAVTLPLRRGLECVGTISISGLPRSSPPDQAETIAPTADAPGIELREASSYRYQLILNGSVPARLEPAELFDPDDSSWMTGRLHTRQYVGDVALTAIGPAGEEIGTTSIVVRAVKLEHEREYRQMLREIADLAAEAVLQGFAPASTATASLSTRAPRLLYQQFAVLQARLQDDELLMAIAEVIHRPQREWIRESEWQPPGRPLRAGSEVARALTKPGPRLPAATQLGPLSTVPRVIESRRTEETLDTVPNRFVKFALTHWRDLAARLGEAVALRGTVAYGVRGTAAVRRVLEMLDDLLAEPLFRGIGRLREFPTSNQVLLKREGYRQIFATFALIESSLDLTLELDDAVHPSQRNIAALYEYWTFLKLVGLLGDVCGDPHAAIRLFEADGDGLSLGLKRGRQSRLKWDVVVAGRRLAVSVYFNRTFRASDEAGTNSSWSTAMVPDASVLIRPVDARTRVESRRDLDVWLHFDAKYKLDWSSSQFKRLAADQEQEAAIADEELERHGTSRRDDLLKMHAYRDAIRRSAGAYVLFPGTSEPLQFREYAELIPGLGAFPLRPGSDLGPGALRRFLDDVLLHAADQATSEERGRFWLSRVFQPSATRAAWRAVQFLDRPPADTTVLLDWISDDRLWLWVEKNEKHVVRLGAPGGITFHAEELAAPLVLLSGRERVVMFGRHGAWSVVSAADLDALGYPAASSAGLLCRLTRIPQQPGWLAELPISEMLATSPRPGEPVAVPWQSLLADGTRGGSSSPRPSRAGCRDERTRSTRDLGVDDEAEDVTSGAGPKRQAD